MEDRFEQVFKSHNTTLPTMYIMVKTHKLYPDKALADIPINEFKVRPIVSCCGSPTEKIGWLATSILKPLLHKIPCHLQNIHSHLEVLRGIEPADLKDWNYTLYTNLSIQGCIDSAIEMLAEHLEDVEMHGLQIRDVQELLELGMGNSFFTYNNKLYRQNIGLFMGYPPSPTVAVIRVYKFEHNSIYIDIYYLPIVHKGWYKRFMDDVGAVAKSREDALKMLQSITEKDPDNMLQWEIDYPDERNIYHF